MFENSNKEAVREIARESMRAHRLRNLTAILGITLTTLLITMVCTVGISFYDTINRGTDILPAPWRTEKSRQSWKNMRKSGICLRWNGRRM